MLDSCTICLENFVDTASRQTIELTCGHVFHTDCMSQHSKRGNSCPNCRAPFFCQDCPSLHAAIYNEHEPCIKQHLKCTTDFMAIEMTETILLTDSALALQLMNAKEEWDEVVVSDEYQILDDDEQHHILEIATASDARKCVQWLLQNTYVPNQVCLNALNIAVRQYMINVIPSLLTHVSFHNVQNIKEDLVFRLTDGPYLNLVDHFLSKYDTWYTNRVVLNMVFNFEEDKCLDLFKQLHAVHCTNDTIMACLSLRKTKVLRALVEIYGCNVNHGGLTTYCAKCGDLETLQYLIERGLKEGRSEGISTACLAYNPHMLSTLVQMPPDESETAVGCPYVILAHKGDVRSLFLLYALGVRPSNMENLWAVAHYNPYVLENICELFPTLKTFKKNVDKVHISQMDLLNENVQPNAVMNAFLFANRHQMSNSHLLKMLSRKQFSIDDIIDAMLLCKDLDAVTLLMKLVDTYNTDLGAVHFLLNTRDFRNMEELIMKHATCSVAPVLRTYLPNMLPVAKKNTDIRYIAQEFAFWDSILSAEEKKKFVLNYTTQHTAKEYYQGTPKTGPNVFQMLIQWGADLHAHTDCWNHWITKCIKNDDHFSLYILLREQVVVRDVPKIPEFRIHHHYKTLALFEFMMGFELRFT